MKPRIGIGISDFRQLREQDLLFVDKTPLIGEILDSAAQVILLPRPHRFERLLNEFVFTTLSYFDAKGKNPEAVFQAFVLGLLLNLGRDYEVSSNRELGYGRYDVLVLPRDKSRTAVLMELKSIVGLYAEDPEKALEEARAQIEARAYAVKGYPDVLRLAVVSDGKALIIVPTKTGQTACEI